MTAKSRLTAILAEALQPATLEVIDESHHHAGHGGWRPEGETHFRVKVVSRAFEGKNRVERHRMVNALASGELKAGLHALAIEAKTPAEAGLPAAASPRQSGPPATIPGSEMLVSLQDA